MNKKQIQSECLIAFIHSRLIGLGKPSDLPVKKAFDEKNCSEKARYIGIYYENKLSKIATFQKIQNKISPKNYALSKIYYSSYKKLEHIFDKYAPTGTEVIEGLIGLNLLSLYAELWDYHNLNIDFERLTSAMTLYEQQVNDDIIFKNMAKLAENIYEDYTKYVGV